MTKYGSVRFGSSKKLKELRNLKIKLLKNHWNVIFGGLLSLIVVLIVLYHVDLEGLYHSFHKLKWQYIPLLIIIYICSFIFRGFRWQIMLNQIKRIKFCNAYGIILIGYMANNIFPARLGEIARAFAINSVENIGWKIALSSIFLERIFDGIILLFLFACSLLLSPRNIIENNLILHIGHSAVIIFTIAMAIILVARIWPNSLRLFLKKAYFFKKGRNFIFGLTDSFIKSTEFIKINYDFCFFFLLCVASWIAEGMMFCVGLFAFGLSPTFSLAFLTLTIVNFGLLVPSAPGYIGVFQGCVILSFSLFGIGKEIGLGYSLVIHTLQYLTATLLGLFYLIKFKISFKFIQNIKIGSPL